MFSTTKQRIIPPFVVLTLTMGCTEKKQPAAEIQKMPVQNKSIQDLSQPYNMDKSPMDVIYFPVDYPVLKMSGKTILPPGARVLYSRPEKDGRTIFGNVVHYGAYWRLGANESTEIEFFADVNILGKKVKKGRYVIYCIPYADKWNIRLSSDLFTWGLKVHPSKDIYSFDIPVFKSEKIFEVFTMEFHGTGNNAQLRIAWDDVQAFMPVNF